MMTSLGLTIACVLFAVLYVFSRVEVATSDHALKLRWVVLRGVPFASRTLSTSDIEGVEPYSFKRHWKARAQFFGPIWPAPHGRILIKLKRDHLRMVRGYVLAVDDPDALTGWLRSRLR